MDPEEAADPAPPSSSGSPTEVFSVFLRLGLTSFGGPIAHLGYFHRELVERRRWLSPEQYSQLLALCQFLPGPASSQVGFCLGWLRGGGLGALAAFLGFTLPSAVLMVLFATALPRLSSGTALAALHGLELVALAVVAHGVLGMSRSLCVDRPRAAIAGLAAAATLLLSNAFAQLGVVLAGAVVGAFACRDVQPVGGSALGRGGSPVRSLAFLLAFLLLLFGLPVLAGRSDGLLAAAEAFYRAGSLVFGGGHVVLPMLEESVVAPGWVGSEDFLSGYGAAQAVPGPMFSLAAFLGARLHEGSGGIAGATVSVIAIFLPGFLLVTAALPMWRSLAAHPTAARCVAGVNAAVVGLLAAALYDPVWVNAVRRPADLAVGIVAFVLLASWRASALVVVLWCVLASVAAHTWL